MNVERTLMTEREKLKVSTRVMYDEFVRKGVEVRIIDAASSLLEFTDTAGETHFMFSTSSDKASAAGLVIANDKIRTELIAKELGILMPLDTVCHTLEDALRFLTEQKCVVLKPLSNSGGNGVSTNITSIAGLGEAYIYATSFGPSVIAQRHINGADVRLLIVAGTFRSAVERRPASVVGDGIATAEELIVRANNSPARSADYMTAMSLINIDGARRYMGDTIRAIPKLDELVSVMGPANLSLGGTAHEATHLVTPQMIADAEKITRKLRLGLCGVDMMWNKATGEYYLIEVNATPGLDLHNEPVWGTSSDAVERYVEWLANPEEQLTKSMPLPYLSDVSLKASLI